MVRTRALWLLLLGGTSCACAGAPVGHETRPATADAPAVTAYRATDRLPHDPDDPAIWVHPQDPARSLILGTIKVAAPDGGLAVFGLDAGLRDVLKGPDRPNNVDVAYGLPLAGVPTDVAVLTERLGRRLRVYAIAPDGSGLRDVSSGGLPVLEGAAGDEGAPMGVALYRRARDGALFAIVSPKSGPQQNYLWQYRLEDDGAGRVAARFVRRFGDFSGKGEIEAVAVDQGLGYVYYADELAGIHKWHADPDHPDAGRELALFGTDGYGQDREGLGVYELPDGTGYILSVDQLPGDSIVHVYRREGTRGNPHDHASTVFSFRSGADETDGLEVNAASLGPDIPGGAVILMNSASRNFLLYRWVDIAAAASPGTLRTSPGDFVPRTP